MCPQESQISTPPRYPTTPCWPGSPSAPPGDRTTLTPQDFLNRELVTTEKLDGSCTALHNGQASPRSPGGRARWLSTTKKYHAWKIMEPGLTLYGEDLLVIHAIEYDTMRPEDTFRLFAVLKDGIFLDWDQVEATALKYNVKTVPVLHRGNFSSPDQLTELLLEEHQKPSVLGGEREGMVIRTSESFPLQEFHRHVCKSVRVGHVQPGLEHWRRHPRQASLTTN